MKESTKKWCLGALVLVLFGISGVHLIAEKDKEAQSEPAVPVNIYEEIIAASKIEPRTENYERHSAIDNYN